MPLFAKEHELVSLESLCGWKTPLLFIIKIVHVVQNNEKKYTRQSKIKETCTGLMVNPHMSPTP